MYFDSALPESLYSRIGYNWHAFEDVSLSKLVCKKGNNKMSVKKSAKSSTKVNKSNTVTKADNSVIVTPVASNIVSRWAIIKKEDKSVIDLCKSRDAARVYKKGMINPKEYTIKKAIVTIF